MATQAWVMLDPSDRTGGMKTVAANRYAGCEAEQSHWGYALYVNEWHTDSRELILMWGGSADGCLTIKSKAGLMQLVTTAAAR